MIHRSFWLRPSHMQLVWVYGFQLDNEALISSIVWTYIVWALQKQWAADCNWIFWRMWCAMRKRKTQGAKAVVEPTHVESKRPDRSLQSLLTLACRIGFAESHPPERSGRHSPPLASGRGPLPGVASCHGPHHGKGGRAFQLGAVTWTSPSACRNRISWRWGCWHWVTASGPQR